MSLLSKVFGMESFGIGSKETEFDKLVIDGLVKKFQNGDIFVNDSGAVEVSEKGMKKMIDDYYANNPEPIMGR